MTNSVKHFGFGDLHATATSNDYDKLMDERDHTMDQIEKSVNALYGAIALGMYSDLPEELEPCHEDYDESEQSDRESVAEQLDALIDLPVTEDRANRNRENIEDCKQELLNCLMVLEANLRLAK